MPYDLACWDLDGVIADSSRAIPACINLALREIGLADAPVEELRRFIGPPLLDTFRLIIQEAGGDAGLAHSCVDSYRRHYATESLLTTTVYPGVREALTRLHRQVPLVVVTSKPTDAALPILAALEVEGYFENVFAPALDALVEPKTETLRRALEAIRFRPGQRGVMIGDRSHDVIAGQANGLATIGVLWGFGSAAELSAAGADQVIDSPPELERLLLD